MSGSWSKLLCCIRNHLISTRVLLSDITSNCSVYGWPTNCICTCNTYWPRSCLRCPAVCKDVWTVLVCVCYHYNALFVATIWKALVKRHSRFGLHDVQCRARAINLARDPSLSNFKKVSIYRQTQERFYYFKKSMSNEAEAGEQQCCKYESISISLLTSVTLKAASGNSSGIQFDTSEHSLPSVINWTEANGISTGW